MSNGIRVILAASVIAIAACDGNPVSRSSRPEAGASTERASFDTRYQVDAARGRVWWLTSEGVFLHDAKAPRKIAVAIPGWHWVGAGYSCLPALALGPKGEALVTSNVLPTVWKIDPDDLTVSVHALALDADLDKDVGFSALVYSAEHSAFFAASDMHGSLWRIDPALTRAQKVELPAPIRNACGLAVGTRTVAQKAERPAGLCVRTRQGDWNLHLAPDQRSAHPQAAPCTDRPWLIGQLALRSE